MLSCLKFKHLSLSLPPSLPLSPPPSRSEVLSEKEAGGAVIEVNVIQRLQQPIFPTKCTSCGSQARDGKKLQRCSTCKAVGYCDRYVEGSLHGVIEGLRTRVV